MDDASNETASFKDVAGNDYDYWLDGSLKKDNNKDITQIDYNYLKLPKQIFLTGGRWIKYEYDANGTKLKKTLSTGKVTDYEEDEIYVNGVLYQTSHDEGRIVDGIYEYDIKDHLGNLRIAFKDNGGIPEITQSIFYDPWGLSMKGMQFTKNPANFNKHQFLNRETQFETGLIDLQNRQYDPQRGQMTSIDALAELNRRFSPFVYGNNNGLRFIDPDGMLPKGLIDDLWNKSDDNTTWTNNGNGAFEGDNGGSVQGSDDKDKSKPLPTLAEAMAKPHLNPNGDGINPNYTIESAIIGGKIFKPVAGLIGKAWGGLFGKSVWSLNPFERGREVESMLGGNLPGNFPVIDKFVNGVATSIKSVDLSSASYQSTSGLRALLNGYVNSVSEFTGRSWAGAQVGTNATNQILSRTLEIAIPRGSVTTSQQAVMNQIIQNGLNATNPVTVTFIPL